MIRQMTTADLMLCAWCDRPSASMRPLMSREHPACTRCYTIWYENGGISPDQLRELSLALTTFMHGDRGY